MLTLAEATEFIFTHEEFSDANEQAKSRLMTKVLFQRVCVHFSAIFSHC